MRRLILAIPLLCAACDDDSSSTAQSATDGGVVTDGTAATDAHMGLGRGDALEPDLGAPPEPGLSAVWANEGGDKVAREETRAAADPTAVHNSVWDGERVRLFAARNEIVAFNLVLEAAADRGAQRVRVALDRLEGPDGAVIQGREAAGDGVFDWNGRDIELFYVRYLQIKGISVFGWALYDERHTPRRFRRPHDEFGQSGLDWTDRPDHGKAYPDIAVPLELEGRFDIAAGTSQAVWGDIYVPRDAAPGVYTGVVTVQEHLHAPREIPIELEVLDFGLPDVPTTKTMVVMSYSTVNDRYLGITFPNQGPDGEASKRVRDRHWQVAKRHRLSIVDDLASPDPHPADKPPGEWFPRLDGTLFTPEKGYRGPGEGVGNGVFVVGLYGTWGWKAEGEEGMHRNCDAWQAFFDERFPDTTVYLYLIDESTDYPQIEEWAAQAARSPGPGSRMKTLATLGIKEAVDNTPSLKVVGNAFILASDAQRAAIDSLVEDPEKELILYHGYRPASGTYMIDDDGVALRVNPWAQRKLGVSRWFTWESTYYKNFQGMQGDTDVFNRAQTFGTVTGDDRVLGETGALYANGDGVLFYPGTDMVFPMSSYGVQGPFASLRMKAWRRGIQDVEYLALAEAVDPVAARAVVDRILPKALWEYGVSNAEDPTFVFTDIAWSTDPDDWEAARRDLAEIILGGG